ncbi:hypothetical protein HKX48_008751 [Thoreauomyces humboldtii]|nr:hypothetical protein HKX48_008751 [Thoreauomyces humboldtii]
MMDLAGHIQQQNSSRQKKLEELTEELAEARRCMQQQATVITNLRERGQLIVQATNGQREKVEFNDQRVAAIENQCKLFQMTLKNLGALIKKTQESKRSLSDALEQRKSAMDRLATRITEISADRDREAGKVKEMQDTSAHESKVAKEKLEQLQIKSDQSDQELSLSREQNAQATAAHEKTIASMKSQWDRVGEALQLQLGKFWRRSWGSAHLQAKWIADQTVAEADRMRTEYAEHRSNCETSVADMMARIQELGHAVEAAKLAEENLLGEKDELSAKAEGLSQELSLAKQTLETLQAENARLVDDLINLQLEKDEEEAAALATMRKHKKDADEDKRCIEEMLEFDRERLNAEIKSLKRLANDTDSRHAENIAALEQIRLSQSQEIERMGAGTLALQAAVEDARQAHALMEEQHRAATFESTSATQAQHFLHLEEQRKADASCAALQATIADLQRSVENLQQEKLNIIDQKERQLSLAATELGTKQSNWRIATQSLESQLKEARAQHSAAEKMNQELFAEKPKQAMLAAKLQELNKKVTDLRIANETTTAEKQAALKDGEDISQKLQDKETELAEQIAAKVSVQEQMEAQTLQYREEQALLRTASEGATQKLALIQQTSEKEFAALKKQFESTEARREAEKSSLMLKLNTLRAEKEQTIGVAERLRGEIAGLQEQLTAKSGQIEQLRTEMSVLSAQQAKLAEEHRLVAGSGLPLGATAPGDLTSVSEQAPKQASTAVVVGSLRRQNSLRLTPSIPRTLTLEPTKHVAPLPVSTFSQIESQVESNGCDSADMLQEYLAATAAEATVMKLPNQEVIDKGDSDGDSDFLLDLPTVASQQATSERQHRPTPNKATPTRVPPTMSRTRSSDTEPPKKKMRAKASEKATEIAAPPRLVRTSAVPAKRSKLNSPVLKSAVNVPAVINRPRKGCRTPATAVSKQSKKLQVTDKKTRQSKAQQAPRPPIRDNSGGSGSSPAQSETSVTTTTTIHTQHTKRIYSTRKEAPGTAVPSRVPAPRVTRANTASRRQLLALESQGKPVSPNEDLFGWPPV